MAVSAALLPTLSLVATGIGVAGSVIGTFANVQSANYQAMIAERNKKIQLENADRAIARSQQEQYMQDRQAAYMLGQQEAQQGASGLKVGGRSFMLTRRASRELARLDALNIRQAGQLEAYNYRVASEDSAAAASFARSQAMFSLLGGFLDAGTSLIGGIGNYNKALQLQTPARSARPIGYYMRSQAYAG